VCVCICLTTGACQSWCKGLLIRSARLISGFAWVCERERVYMYIVDLKEVCVYVCVCLLRGEGGGLIEGKLIEVEWNH